MFKILLLSVFAMAISTAHANGEIRSTIVQITGPKTKLILSQFIQDVNEADSSIVIDRQIQIPDITYGRARFDNLTDRQALSQMRALALEAANCSNQSESKDIPARERAGFLKRCFAQAINENMWNSLNFGAWISRAKRENKVALFSYGVSTTFKSLKLSQVTVIQKIVEKTMAELGQSQDAVKSEIEMATFN